MPKSKAREYVWLQCSDCGDLNYRTQIRVAGDSPKLALKKFCPRTRTHTEHKIKRK